MSTLCSPAVHKALWKAPRASYGTVQAWRTSLTWADRMSGLELPLLLCWCL